MSEFIGYTVGLLASNEATSTLLKVEYTRGKDGSVLLCAVSGNTLAKAYGKCKVSAEEFADRPNDPYDNIKEARWALGKCGWTIGTDN